MKRAVREEVGAGSDIRECRVRGAGALVVTQGSVYGISREASAGLQQNEGARQSQVVLARIRRNDDVRIVRTIADLRPNLAPLRPQVLIGFVPTMGAWHSRAVAVRLIDNVRLDDVSTAPFDAVVGVAATETTRA